MCRFEVDIFAIVHKKATGGTFGFLKIPWVILVYLLPAYGLMAQESPGNSFINVDSIQKTSSLHLAPAAFKKRQKTVAISLAAAYGGTLALLNEAWYKQYPRTRFHTFNDSREWLQVDKLGHGWSAYQLARATGSLWQWAGKSTDKSVLAAGAGSLMFLTLIELMDARSEKWGWSWADMAANTGGVLLYAGQQWGWQEQRLQMKFSVAPTRYSPMLQARAKELFGTSLPEQILKDYNNQTYWLSANLASFFSNTGLPAWLNVAVGYGATGMFGGFENMATDKEGNIIFSRKDIRRERQWYLSPDIDLTKIKTSSKGVKTMLFLLNCIKVPAPALELRNGKIKARGLHF